MWSKQQPLCSLTMTCFLTGHRSNWCSRYIRWQLMSFTIWWASLHLMAVTCNLLRHMSWCCYNLTSQKQLSPAARHAYKSVIQQSCLVPTGPHCRMHSELLSSFLAPKKLYQKKKLSTILYKTHPDRQCMVFWLHLLAWCAGHRTCRARAQPQCHLVWCHSRTCKGCCWGLLPWAEKGPWAGISKIGIWSWHNLQGIAWQEIVVQWCCTLDPCAGLHQLLPCWKRMGCIANIYQQYGMISPTQAIHYKSFVGCRNVELTITVCRTHLPQLIAIVAELNNSACSVSQYSA